MLHPKLCGSCGIYNLTIDASTNGWWIVKPENTGWITINRMIGSAKVVQQIKIGANTTSVPRKAAVEVRVTNNETKVIQINQEG